MALTFQDTKMLKSLIEHHIALINRFGSENFEEFSLLFLKLDKSIDLNTKKSIQIIFRESDILFEYESGFILLLPKTSWSGASNLLKNLQKFLNQKFEDTIITFPDDGQSVEKLLENFSSLVKKSYNIKLKF
jgi:Tfp pilus assembly pilus retraction ATPase PilT